MDTKLHNLFNRSRINDRQVNELIGIASGIAADGVVNQTEAEFLQRWLAANVDTAGNPMVRTLLCRVNEMLADARIDSEESAELLDTLKRFSGGDFELGEALKATRLPVDRPEPQIVFPQKRFTFTGTFAYGSRKECEEAAKAQGASVGGLAKTTDFLVIGIYATDSWAHSAFGRKIEQAVEWRDGGSPIKIVTEEHWVQHLPG